MSLKINNNNCFAYSLTRSYMGTPIEEKKTLGMEELEALIDVLPEMRMLEEVMDNFYSKLHDDSKLSQFSRIFCQILTNNSNVIQGLDSFKKAQLLFGKYVELTLLNLYKTEKFEIAFKSLQRKVGEFLQDGSIAQMTTKIVDKNYKSRIISLHSSFIGFAVGSVLDIKPWDIRFSSEYQSTGLDENGIDLSILKG